MRATLAGSFGIERELFLLRRALRHRAESAAARAQVAQDHERRRAAVKAFMHVRAARRFANRVQIQLPQILLQIVNGREMRGAFAQPLRQARLWLSGAKPVSESS